MRRAPRSHALDPEPRPFHALCFLILTLHVDRARRPLVPHGTFARRPESVVLWGPACMLLASYYPLLSSIIVGRIILVAFSFSHHLSFVRAWRCQTVLICNPRPRLPAHPCPGRAFKATTMLVFCAASSLVPFLRPSFTFFHFFSPHLSERHSDSPWGCWVQKTPRKSKKKRLQGSYEGSTAKTGPAA